MLSRFIPNTPAQQRQMLDACGAADFDMLFADIPPELRRKSLPDIPAAKSEMEVLAHIRTLAGRNASTASHVCFLGAGVYDHYIPSVVNHLISRQEFYTAYTPYQPEISQGTLQAIFEYQSMIATLTGMEVANASMYDGATALAEAASMACVVKRRGEVLVARAAHPHSRGVLNTYARFKGVKVTEYGARDGASDLGDLERQLSDNTAAVLIQTPNFFGTVENIAAAAELAHRHGALLIVAADPIALGILKAPGSLGADIVVGEGQGLGSPLNFGGPYLGFFAAKAVLMRKMPGRIVGATVDHDGRRGFVLTLQTREQHIRREKATSNICSNEGLNALAATVYLATVGREGLREVAAQCARKAHYTCGQLAATGRFTPAFGAPFFHEFTLKTHGDIAALNERLLAEGFLGGYDLGRDYPEYAGCWLIAVTEKRTREEIDAFAGKAAQA